MDSAGKRQEFPSLFAWHGSPLGNWHSIIRTGLDFQTLLHRRVFGHGVYMNRNLAVSEGYSLRASSRHRDSIGNVMVGRSPGGVLLFRC